MLELFEIEELLKSEDLYKTKNKAAIRALLQNAAVLHQEGATEEQKRIATQNIKAITNPQPKIKEPKIKEPKTTSFVAPKKSTPLSVSQPAAQPVKDAPKAIPTDVPKADPSRVKLKYSPIYQHYGFTQEHWDNPSAPDAHEALFNFHNDVMAGKHPEFAHVKAMVEKQAKTKMKKSIDSLYGLFIELKKNI